MRYVLLVVTTAYWHKTAVIVYCQWKQYMSTLTEIESSHTIILLNVCVELCCIIYVCGEEIHLCLWIVSIV